MVYAIADARGTDPAELNFCLHDFISPEAIERLYAHDGSAWELEFTVGGHEVRLDDGGTIHVDGIRFRGGD